jgi:hypothetical protein
LIQTTTNQHRDIQTELQKAHCTQKELELKLSHQRQQQLDQ